MSQGMAETAVPLLFMMSGYFFFLGYGGAITEYKKKLNSRVKTLLIPFLFWNIFTLFLLALAQSIPATQIYFSGNVTPISQYGLPDYFNAIFGINRLPISAQFWFVRDLMAMVLLVPIIQIILKVMPKLFLLIVFYIWFFRPSWFFSIWPVNVPTIIAIAFFCAGAYFANSNISLFALDRFGKEILSFYVIILLVDVYTKGYSFNYYLHNACVLFGVASALFISKIIVRFRKTKTFLLGAGGCSFFVFAVHEPLQSIFRKIIYRYLMPTSDVVILTLYFLIPSLVITLSIFLYVGMKSVTPRFLSIIAGGR